MSIHDFTNKIKGVGGINKGDIAQVIIIILVAFGAFYLGKISNIQRNTTNVDIVNSKTGEGI